MNLSSPYSILLLVAVVLFVLSALSISLGAINLVSLGLAAMAGAFLLGRDWRR